jgi:hydroxymethylpyrimidine/phosphomethylpyrimidine kinase
LTAKPARILIIAGSDSSGGAGIQADIKTATALGCYAMTAVTAVTAQNTTGVQSIHPIPPAIVREQIEACLSDIGADAIKIGMLGSAEIVNAVADALGQARNIHVVLDPVMIAKGGASLTSDAAVEALKARLIPLSTLITPNIPEAEVLSGLKVAPGKATAAAADGIRALGAEAVLMKGGHAEGENVADILIDGYAITVFASPRLETKHTHGTGCTLSTAIACRLGQGMSLADAVERAHNYVHEAIRAAPGFGSGHGPLNHMHGKIR